MSPRRKADHIYVLTGGDGLTKFGISFSPLIRANNLRQQMGIEVDVFWEMRRPDGDARQIETLSHRILEPYRVNGEWFSVSPDIAVSLVKVVAHGIITEQSLRPKQKNHLRDASLMMGRAVTTMQEWMDASPENKQEAEAWFDRRASP